MEKTIIVTGKTIEQAVESALAQLGLSQDDISYQVLAQAKPGFLGIGATPYKVEVTYQAPDPVPEKPKSALGSASRSKPKAAAPKAEEKKPVAPAPKAEPPKAEAPKAEPKKVAPKAEKPERAEPQKADAAKEQPTK